MRRVLGVLVVLLVVGSSASALAKARTRVHRRATRRLFEPSHLQLQPPGMLQLDLQMGVIQGASAARMSLPDAELSLGLASWLEFDVTGSLALEGRPGHSLAYDHIYRDNVWTAFKVALFDYTPSPSSGGFGLGLQLGPKWPVTQGVHDVGIEGLLLASWCSQRACLSLGAGGLADPVHDDGSGRSHGVEGGTDVAWFLDGRQRWSLLGSVGFVLFTSRDPNQVNGTFGVGFTPNQSWSFSLMTLGGLPGSDRYGLLFGVSPSMQLVQR
jgi:hypothetical protein